MGINRYIIQDFKQRFLIKPYYYLHYIRWQISQALGVRNKIKTLFSILFFTRLVRNDLKKFDRLCCIGNRSFSWASYESDGTRALLFDHEDKSITKISSQENRLIISDEIDSRSRLGIANPAIISFSIDQGILSEQWIKLKPLEFQKVYLEESVKILRNRLYEPHLVSRESYVSSLSAVLDKNRINHYLEMVGLDELTVSRVHGDLWAGNLATDKKGNLIILDWEYTRDCVWTYDIWSYLRQGFGDEINSEAFFEELSFLAKKLLEESCTEQQAQGYHLVHLVELHTFFTSLNLSHKNHEIQSLSSEVYRILKS